MRMRTLATSLFFVLLLVPVARAQDVGTVVEAAGTVEIDRSGATIAATAGAALTLHDVVRTGKPGRARLVFRDDSVLTLADESTLAIDESVVSTDSGSWSSAFSLFVGKVRVLVSDYYSDAGASFEVRTPTSVSGVRGTEFVVSHSERERLSQVLGLEGAVRVHGVVDLEGPGVVVRAGEFTTIAQGGEPSPPRKAGVKLENSTLENLLIIGDGNWGQVPISPTTDDGQTPGSDETPKPQVDAQPSTPKGNGQGAGSASASEAAGKRSALPPAFPGEGPANTPSDILGQPADVVEEGGGVGVGF